MQIKGKVNQKGEVVIPESIRNYLHIKPGSIVILETRNKEIVIKPIGLCCIDS